MFIDEGLALYTSEKHGSDGTGDGSEGKPFKTVLHAMRTAKEEPFPVIMVDGKDESSVSSFEVRCVVINRDVHMQNLKNESYQLQSQLIIIITFNHYSSVMINHNHYQS